MQIALFLLKPRFHIIHTHPHRIRLVVSAMLRERSKRMDYEADYTADAYVSDDDTIDEPRHSFTQEVRDLFGVSLVTDLVVEHHSDECRDSTGRVRGHRCTCPTVSYHYLGHRAIPEEGIENLRITPTFQGVAFLEEYCEQNISRLRTQASKRSAHA
jgi:hypothetical protein